MKLLRFISAFLVIVMLATLMPMSAIAAEVGVTETGEVTTEAPTETTEAVTDVPETPATEEAQESQTEPSETSDNQSSVTKREPAPVGADADLAEVGAVYTGTLGSNVRYSIDSETGVCTISGSGTMTDYGTTDNSPLDNYTQYFDTVIIEDGITSIGKAMFRGCDFLFSVSIPDSVKSIGDYAFSGCQYLSSIKIPEGVTTIGEHTFWGCTNLSEIILPSSVSRVEYGAFRDCESLDGISFKGELSYIGPIAFSYTNLKYLVLPGTMVNFDENGNDSLSKIFLGASTKNLTIYGYEDSTVHSFANSKGINFRAIGSSNIVVGQCGDNAYYILNLTTGAMTITGTGDTRNPYTSEWDYCEPYIKSVIIENGITSIDRYFFFNCDNLASIEISDSVTSIGASAFYGCTSLASVKLPKSLETIDEYTFGNCNGLTSIVIPEGVTTIGTYAFQYCTSLKSIEIPQGVTSIGERTFYECTSLESVTLPESLTSIGDWDFYNCRKLASIEIPEGVTSIGINAFNNCTGLTSVVIPESVTSINQYAFVGCSNLTEAYIYSREVEFGADVFGGLYYDLTIYGYTGSTAETYANSHDHNFVALDGGGDDTASYEVTLHIKHSETETWAPYMWIWTDHENERLDVYDAWPGQPATLASDGWYEASFSLYEGDTYGFVVSNNGYPQTIDYDYYTESELWIVINDYQAGTHFGDWCTVFPDKPSAEDYCNLINQGLSGQCGENAYYSLDFSTGVLTISGTGYMYGYNYGTAPWFSYISYIDSIVIEEGITSVGFGNFWDCSAVTTVSLPSTLQFIDQLAFVYCRSLTSVEIPEGVTSIGKFAFQECSSLSYVSIPSTVQTMEQQAFALCPYLSSVTLSEGVETIGAFAFYQCGALQSIEIPESVTFIGNNAFDGCSSLTKAFIYSRDAAFVEATFVNVAEGFTIYGYSDSTAQAHAEEYGLNFVALDVPITGQCGDNAYYSLDLSTGVLTITGTGDIYGYNYGAAPWSPYVANITDIVIEEGITSIGFSNFVECAAVSVSLPTTLKTIAQQSFYGCDGLTSLDIPEGVTSIGMLAFQNCYSLTSVSIPSTVVTVGQQAFAYCPNLYSLTLTEGIETIGAFAFYQCGSLQSIEIPDGVTTIGNNAFDGCSSLAKAFIYSRDVEFMIEVFIENADGFTIYGYSDSTAQTHAETYGLNFVALDVPITGQCGDNAYYSLDLSTGVLTITGTGGIYGYNYGAAPWSPYAADITGIVIEEGITSIGFSNFVECAAVSVSLPETLQIIGQQAFHACSSLESVEIPEGVTTIMTNAFAYCTNLSTIDFAQGLESIETSAFYGCTSLESIDIPEGVISIGLMAFQNCTSLASVSVPGSVQTIGQQAFAYCPNLSTVDLAEGIETIEHFAFYDCSSLESVNIPSTVKRIGQQAFAYCTNLKAIDFAQGLESIELGAFYVCTSLESIDIPESVTYIGESAFDSCTNLKEAYIYSKDAEFAVDIFLGVTEDLVIYGYINSTAQAYAEANNHTFVPIEEGFKITYVLGGGTLTDEVPEFCEGVLTAEYLPAAVRDGYVFAGWYMDEQLTTPAQVGAEITEDIELYASWIEIDSVSIGGDDPTANASSGSGFELYGAQIRTEPSMGLRFCTRVSSQLMSDIENITGSDAHYGYVLVRKDSMNPNAEVKVGAETINGAVLSERMSEKDFYTCDDYIVYTACVLNIPLQNYNDQIAARPFIKYTDVNGIERYHYYTETGSKNLGGAYYTSLYSFASYVVDNGLESEEYRNYLAQEIIGPYDVYVDYLTKGENDYDESEVNIIQQ